MPREWMVHSISTLVMVIGGIALLVILPRDPWPASLFAYLAACSIVGSYLGRLLLSNGSIAAFILSGAFTSVVFLSGGLLLDICTGGPLYLEASVCGSERYFYRGISVRPEDEARGRPDERAERRESGELQHTYPMGPLGHEGGGTIVEVGSAVKEYLRGGKVSVGDRVGSLIFPTYTDYWVTDISNVQPIPEGVAFEVGCLYEALTCAAWAARHIDIRLGDTVAVNGAGFSGNVLLQGAIKSGASMVIAVDVVEQKLELAKELGADVVINAQEEDPVERVNELTDDEGVDVAVEAVGGTGIGIVQALGMVAHNGLLALYGDNYAPVKEFCFHRFHEDGLRVQNLNAMHYTKLQAIENAREAYRAVQRGVFDIDIILEHSDRYCLDEIADVFAKEAESLDTQQSLKTLIIP